MKIAITAERLRKLLHYDPRTGLFTWLKTRGPCKCGSTAGTPHNGYVRIQIDGALYRAHRLAWLYMKRAWPVEVDHRHGNGSDNRWKNLRSIGRSANMQNQRRAHRNNRGTGLLGSYPCGTRYRASIWVRGKARHIGTYYTAKAAHEAYVAAKRVMHEGCTI